MKHTKEEKLHAFERLLDVQERLRKDCPWDRKQTFESLRTNTIEEVFELCDALMKGDRKEICKELGDVMEHVILYSIMLEDTADDYDIADVCNHQADKLMFRHTFLDWAGWELVDKTMEVNGITKNATPEGNTANGEAKKPRTANEVSETWEQAKLREKDGNKRVLSGVPDALPSLIKAWRIQDKVRNVGFDWAEKEQVWDKVREEMGELEAELRRGDQQRSAEELGDFIFSVVNAARLYHINPDNALEHTNQKFIRRFNYVEDHSIKQGRNLRDMTIEEMDELWNEAKKQERPHPTLSEGEGS